MLEIVFSDSACGSLKLAQHYGDGSYIGGAVGVIVSHSGGSEPTAEEIEQAQREAEERERRQWENAVPMGGDPRDVHGFSLMLSVGDITEDLPGEKRLEAMDRMLCYNDPEIKQFAVQCVSDAHKTIQLVRDRLEKGEKIRIWSSAHPDELCAVYWLMAQLKVSERAENVLYEVRLPDCEKREDGSCIQWHSWGEVAPHQWRYFAEKYERIITEEQQRHYAARWRALQRENTPLRIVRDHTVYSVSEDYYDDMIRRIVDAQDDEFFAANVVGRAIIQSDMQISDGFVWNRLDEMIANGELEALTQPQKEHPNYHRMLRKIKK